MDKFCGEEVCGEEVRGSVSSIRRLLVEWVCGERVDRRCAPEQRPVRRGGGRELSTQYAVRMTQYAVRVTQYADIRLKLKYAAFEMV